MIDLFTTRNQLSFKICVWRPMLIIVIKNKTKQKNLLQIGAGQHSLEDNSGHYGIWMLLEVAYPWYE